MVMPIEYSADKKWIRLWDDDNKEWSEIRSWDAPDWVRRWAAMDLEEKRNNRPKLRCVMGGGYYFRPGDGDDLLDDFRLVNPEYIKAARMRKKGKRMPMPDRWVEAFRRLPASHPWGDGAILPRGADLSAYKLVGSDARSFPEPEYNGADPFETGDQQYRLREYQRDAVEACREHEQGVVRAPCGAGKTEIGVGLIAALDTKALVLVHTLDLAQQWVERLESRYPDLDVTMVGDGENDSSGRVVIATIQTLARWRWEETYALGKQFGLVILDEAHHAPARTFTDVLCAMPARYRIGLTATPERDDGLTDMLWWNFGKEIFAISHSKLEKAGHIVTPQVVWLDSMWEPEDTELPWASIMSGLVSCELRNKALFDITANAVGQGRTVLFLSERVAHCTSMAEWFNDNGIEAAALVGSLSQKKRTDLLKDARDGRFKVVTATVLADEGLDLPNFDTLVLATPTRALGRVQQRIGRIMRPLDGKQDPLVYDMRDAWGPLRGQARKRESFYRKLLQ